MPFLSFRVRVSRNRSRHNFSSLYRENTTNNKRLKTANKTKLRRTFFGGSPEGTTIFDGRDMDFFRDFDDKTSFFDDLIIISWSLDSSILNNKHEKCWRCEIYLFKSPTFCETWREFRISWKTDRFSEDFSIEDLMKTNLRASLKLRLNKRNITDEKYLVLQ